MTLYLNDQGALEEKAVYAKMITAAHTHQLAADVFVFTPDDVDHPRALIHAHTFDYEKKVWKRAWRLFPDLIYDRCRVQKSARFERLQQFRKRYTNMVYLNHILRHKWTIYELLRKDSRFFAHLPRTIEYETFSDVANMLQTYPLLYLKPTAGTGGRGIVRLEKRKQNQVLLAGRTMSRTITRARLVPYRRLAQSLIPWKLKQGRYLIQQGIRLTLPNGRVHDYRMLIQKNGNGKWAATGCAGRVGARHSITANLHGGGRAATMDALLRHWFPSAQRRAEIRQEAQRLSIAIAERLEQEYGRLCELALDLAIDQSGHIWLLEVNPKPSREVFARAGETGVYATALVRPLQFAQWLFEQRTKKE